jgi:hypothetical protein
MSSHDVASNVYVALRYGGVRPAKKNVGSLSDRGRGAPGCGGAPAAADLDVHPGRVVQVDPIKAVLKVPGTILLKLRCDGPLSNTASSCF